MERIDRYSEEEVIAECVADWAESSRAMSRLCESYGIDYLHVLQPTLHDTGSKPVADEERAVGIGEDGPEPWIAPAYDALRRAGVELAAEGVPFVDTSQVFAGTTDTL